MIAYEECFVELELRRELVGELVDAVEPLEEDGAALVAVGGAEAVAAPVGKLVAKVEPLALHQRAETLGQNVRGEG